MAVIGGIIGGGIFRTPAAVAERVGSPRLALAAWVVGGAIALVGAFCFGELGRRRPSAGGGYVYLRETWGPLPAFLYGDRKSTRLNSSHSQISYAVFCLKKKKYHTHHHNTTYHRSNAL